jgi:hypothetical protein
MPNTSEPRIPSVPEVRARLEAAAQMLRESSSLDPAVRGELAELLAEFGRVLEAPAGDPQAGTPSAEVVHLAEGTAHLAEALHQRHDRGLVAASRDRLERLALKAEARAPTVVNLARNLIEGLADLGI